MGVQRINFAQAGSWKADTFTDLTTIVPSHGDEAYVVDEGTWYKYDDATGTWRVIVTTVSLP